MRPPIEFLMPQEIGAELIYSFVIIVCSLMVYYGTKELYELSSHKGIKYFRLAFLFFAVAYFFRYSIRFILSFFNIKTMHELLPTTMGPTGPLTLFLFMYFSSIAVFYLLYSVMWKKWNGNFKTIYIFHALAIVISLISILSNKEEILLGINIFLLAIVSFIYYIVHRESKAKKKRHHLYIVYMLLFIFWILNIIDILIPSFLQKFQLLIYLISSGIFLTILYKVLKKTGN
ncbi:MAG: hypothetical protein WCX73_04000 [Candidatus Pacearchaeota archaeon]|jgi:hypothetical protein